MKLLFNFFIMNIKFFQYASLLLIILLCSCKSEVQPKPDGYLRLEYPTADYQRADTNCTFTYLKNTQARIEEDNGCQFKITYPFMNASIYIDYKPITNNLNYLLADAQKLTYNHTIKAESIIEQPFINPTDKVYGMFYNVTGDAATNIQFYATDSVENFIVGTLYFYAKPNYDSIYPATKYVEKDMIRIMESIQWKK